MGSRPTARKSAPRGIPLRTRARTIAVMRTHATRPTPSAAPQTRAAQAPDRAAAAPAASAVPGTLTAESIARLQASAGNRATVQALRTGIVVQRALSVEQAGSIARRLEDAMAGWGTDEEAIYGALAGRTADDMRAIREAYRRLPGGKDLDAELADELTESELQHVTEMMAPVGDESQLSDTQQAAAKVDRARVIADQLRQAMAGWGTEEDQIYNALEGRSADEIDEVRRQYYTLTGHSLERDIRDEMSGSELDRALALINAGNSGSFRNQFSEYLTEGLNAGGEGIWDWEIVGGNFLVHVDVEFRPDAGVTYDLGKWQAKIADIWNRFALVADASTEYPILFDLRNQSGAERTVRVKPNAVFGKYAPPDRAYSDLWFPEMRETIAPHEFGHLVGLADEYERTAEDYRSVTGEPIPETANASIYTAAEIADSLHTALYRDEKAQRAPAATQVCESAGLMVGGAPQQGTFAQRVMQAYDDKYSGWISKTLIEAIRSRCVPGSYWNLLATFSFQSTSIMGNESDHNHPVAPRHLEPVLQVVRARYPAKTWGLKLLR